MTWSFSGPSGENRTHGLLNPIQALYQTGLHPDTESIITHCAYNSSVFLKKTKLYKFFPRQLYSCRGTFISVFPEPDLHIAFAAVGKGVVRYQSDAYGNGVG